MEAVEERMENVDVIVNIRDVFHTNFTGHPSIVVPTRYRNLKSGGSIPICSTFTGQLGDDARLLAIAHKFQQHCSAHLQHPELDSWLEKYEAGTLDGVAQVEREAKPKAKETSDKK